jgi:hypothetical protein
MSTQSQSGFRRLLRPGRRSNGRRRLRPSAHAVAAWMLFVVYLFATACAVWDVAQAASELRLHRTAPAQAVPH